MRETENQKKKNENIRDNKTADTVDNHTVREKRRKRESEREKEREAESENESENRVKGGRL